MITAVGFIVDMPTRPQHLYMNWDHPNGKETHLENRSHPPRTAVHQPRLAMDIHRTHNRPTGSHPTADRLCWAHWTKQQDPHQQFNNPINIPNINPITITPTMIDWTITNICTQPH